MIRVFFGKPGAGKSTLCCKLAKKNSKLYDHTFINFENKVPGCASCDVAGLGEWTFPDHSYICIDESGIEYNNRAYKSMTKECISWLKTHRHRSIDLDFFSQDWADMDITIRRLAVELWYMKKIGPYTLCRRVYKFVTVDQNTQQIIDGYSMASKWWLPFWFLQLGFPFAKRWTLTYRPFYYKYFDSYDAPVLDLRRFPVAVKKPYHFVKIRLRVYVRFISLYSFVPLWSVRFRIRTFNFMEGLKYVF